MGSTTERIFEAYHKCHVRSPLTINMLKASLINFVKSDDHKKKVGNLSEVKKQLQQIEVKYRHF